MELWDVLDSTGKMTGKTMVRGQPLQSGDYHLVVHIWIVDRKGNLLIQRRAEDRYPMPGEWAVTGGSAMAGEDSRTAICRELREELGIACRPDEPILLRRPRRRNAFVDSWLLLCSDTIPVSDLHLQTEEVAGARWVTREELQTAIREGNFHHYGADYFQTLFEGIDAHLNRPDA